MIADLYKELEALHRREEQHRAYALARYDQRLRELHSQYRQMPPLKRMKHGGYKKAEKAIYLEYTGYLFGILPRLGGRMTAIKIEIARLKLQRESGNQSPESPGTGAAGDPVPDGTEASPALEATFPVPA